MTARARYRISNTITIIALVIVAVRLLGMAGVIPRAGQWNGIAWFAFLLLVAARLLRRNAREAMAVEDAAKRQQA